MVPRVKKALSVLLMLAALTAVLTLAAPTPASADRCGTEFYYYSDSTYSEVVGIRGWLPYDCFCQSYFWGEITPYKEVRDSWCG